MYEKSAAHDYQSSAIDRPSTGNYGARKGKRNSEVVTPLKLKETRKSGLNESLNRLESLETIVKSNDKRENTSSQASSPAEQKSPNKN